jgi:hypothetical protein
MGFREARVSSKETAEKLPTPDRLGIRAYSATVTPTMEQSAGTFLFQRALSRREEIIVAPYSSGGDPPAGTGSRLESCFRT